LYPNIIKKVLVKEFGLLPISESVALLESLEQSTNRQVLVNTSIDTVIIYTFQNIL